MEDQWPRCGRYASVLTGDTQPLPPRTGLTPASTLLNIAVSARCIVTTVFAAPSPEIGGRPVPPSRRAPDETPEGRTLSQTATRSETP
jgi:hypothetical protein